jgi:hypothetical protein
MTRTSAKRKRDTGNDFLDDVTIAILVATAAGVLQSECQGADETHPPPKRRREVIRNRLDWDQHAKNLCNEKQFENTYRMSRSSFEKLVRIVSHHLAQDAFQAERRAGVVISTPIAVHTCIRWLAGGKAQDIRLISGFSKPTFYRIIHTVMDAINTAVELQLIFPLSAGQLEEAAAGFLVRSEKGIISGCIGAVDGWLCPIRVPKVDECGKVIAFFSGHYQRYGLNVQACADAHSRITAFSVRSPGGMNDALAFKAWDLSKVLVELEGPYFAVGDNAYSQRPYLMTPYNKTQLAGNKQRDDYNYFISELRIRVEMAFGLMVNKWGILQSPLKVNLSRCPAVISACIRLHNFCINERL